MEWQVQRLQLHITEASWIAFSPKIRKGLQIEVSAQDHHTLSNFSWDYRAARLVCWMLSAWSCPSGWAASQLRLLPASDYLVVLHLLERPAPYQVHLLSHFSTPRDEHRHQTHVPVQLFLPEAVGSCGILDRGTSLRRMNMRIFIWS